MPRLQNDKFSQHGSTISFEMDGEQYNAIMGDSIAAALVSAGIMEFRRDKSGAARGPLCGMGVCFDCQVSIDGGPAQRACLTKVSSGMKIRSLSYRKCLVPDQRPVRGQRECLRCDVLIVGSGPAGMTAATWLAESGANVIVVDERPEPGGQFFKPLASSYSFAETEQPDHQYRDGKALIKSLRRTKAQLINNATVWGAFRGQDGQIELCVTVPRKSLIVRTRQLILATGAFETVPPFPGWTLPGVMTTGAAQGMARAYRVAPGQRVLIAGNGPLNLHLASELIEGGVDVAAVAESAPHPFPYRMIPAIGSFVNSPSLILQGLGYLWRIKRHRVPLLFGFHIASATGNGRVSVGAVSKLGRDGRLLSDTEKRYEVDAVCVGYSLRPSNELARSLGCKHEVVAPGVMVPKRDENGQTNLAGVFVIGDGGAVGGAHVAMAEGKVAAKAVLRNLSHHKSLSDRHDRRVLNRHRRFQRSLWSLYDAPELVLTAPDVPICRCELVSLGKIQSLVANGVRDFGSIKRLTRAGMGPCQGRYCQHQIAKVLAGATGQTAAPQDMFTPRPPIKPTIISTVAIERPEWLGYRTVDRPVDKIPEGRDVSSLHTNVLVIGGGIIGVCAAMYLAKAGTEVVIIDRGVVNGEASGGNAGSLHLQMLSSDFSVDCSNDANFAAKALSLQKMGIDVWQELEREMGADFELEITGGITIAETEDELEFIQKKALLERLNGINVEILSRRDVQKMVPAISDRVVGGGYCAGEGKINPMLATPFLLREALEAGATFRAKTAAKSIEYRDGKYLVMTSNGSISCHKIINATGGWAASIASMVGATLPVMTAPQQMIVTEPTDSIIDYLIAAARRHLTMKQASNGNIIIGGGWPASYELESDRAVTLRQSIEGNLWVAQRVIPVIGLLQFIRTWATTGVMIDGAPIIGEMPGQSGFFNAVGANGYTMGPLLGRITADLATTGERITDIRPFSVDRFN